MKKPNAKDRILETASALFFERGFSEVGINEIIEKAETAKATFYQHFPSKESLCEAWLKFVHFRSESMRNAILVSEATPVEKVMNYFDGLERFMADSEFRGCPYSNTGAVVAQGCCGIREQIESHKRSVRQFFETLSAQIADNARAQTLADTLFLLYSGAATEAQNLRDLWPVKAARKAALESCEGAVRVNS